MKNKLLAGLLSVCMMVSLVQGIAYAEPAESTVPQEAVQETASAQEVVQAQNEVPVTESLEAVLQTTETSENMVTPEQAGEYHQVDFDLPLIGSQNVDSQAAIPSYMSDYLPSEYDNRSILPAVRNQNPYGTCWTFASMAAAEGSLIAQNKQVDENVADATIDLSEYQLAYFHYNSVADPLGNTIGDDTIGQDIWYGTGDLDGTEDLKHSYLELGGNLMFATWTLANWQAGADESTAPYNSISTAGLDDSVAYQEDKVHLENAYWVPMAQPQYVKQMIMEYGAVGASYLDGSGYTIAFNEETSAYYSGTLASDDATANYFGGHAISIVGWNDNFSKTNFSEGCQPTSDGAWLVRNSWGSSFGDNGYFWMSYAEPTLDSVAMVFDFADADNYDYNYQYDGSCGVNGWADIQGHSVANVFQVKGTGTQMLEAVGAGLYGENVEYSIQIYMDPKAGNPLSGTPMLPIPQMGSATFTGYHTIELFRPVELEQGHTFSVVITFENSGGIFLDTTYANGNWIRFVSATQAN